MTGMVRRWIRFNVVGLVGVPVQLVTFTVFLVVAGFHYMLATVLAVEAAVVHNFVWHERWTWSNRFKRGNVMSRFACFNLSNGLVSIAGNLFLMRFWVGTFQVNPIVANVFAIGTCALLNFFLSDRFVFAEEPLPSDEN